MRDIVQPLTVSGLLCHLSSAAYPFSGIGSDERSHTAAMHRGVGVAQLTLRQRRVRRALEDAVQMMSRRQALLSGAPLSLMQALPLPANPSARRERWVDPSRAILRE